MKLKIARGCSDFLKASNGIPLIRLLPKAGPSMRSVKIRKKKSASPFDKAFNTVFIDHKDVRQRCIFVNGSHTRVNDSSLTPFYIFPKNGFKFMYSTAVVDSGQQYGAAFDDLIKAMDVDTATSIIGDVLSYDYKTTNLSVGLLSGCEIIIFNCPSYFAIRRDTVKSYSTLFSL